VAQKGQAPVLTDTQPAAGQPCPGVQTMRPAMALSPQLRRGVALKRHGTKNKSRTFKPAKALLRRCLVNENRSLMFDGDLNVRPRTGFVADGARRTGRLSQSTIEITAQAEFGQGYKNPLNTLWTSPLNNLCFV
jgi:hypothetical protein